MPGIGTKKILLSFVDVTLVSVTLTSLAFLSPFHFISFFGLPKQCSPQGQFTFSHLLFSSLFFSCHQSVPFRTSLFHFTSPHFTLLPLLHHPRTQSGPATCTHMLTVCRPRSAVQSVSQSSPPHLYMSYLVSK